jgi:hypothetical protein
MGSLVSIVRDWHTALMHVYAVTKSSSLSNFTVARFLGTAPCDFSSNLNIHTYACITVVNADSRQFTWC